MIGKSTKQAGAMPRWVAATAVAATFAFAFAAAQVPAQPEGDEPAVTHASILDGIFRVFQEFIGWKGFEDDDPVEPSNGW